MYDELINALRCNENLGSEKCSNCGFSGNCLDLDSVAADAIQSLQSELAALKEANRWISTTERLPDEHDSIFSKRYDEGTQLPGMFRKVSDVVIVTGLYDDGGKFVTHSKTHDGAWDVSRVVNMSITHWRPLPKPPKGAE